MRPYLYKRGGVWRCISKLGVGWGATARDAYADWASVCGFI